MGMAIGAQPVCSTVDATNALARTTQGHHNIRLLESDQLHATWIELTTNQRENIRPTTLVLHF